MSKRVNVKLIVTTKRIIPTKTDARRRLLNVSFWKTVYYSKSKYSCEYENVPLTPKFSSKNFISFKN